MLYYFLVDKLIPHANYENKIEFDIAYLNQDEKLLIFFQNKVSTDLEYQSIDVPSSKVLNHISLNVPYIYMPRFILVFGDSNNVTFAISNLSVNGKLILNSKIKNELDLIGYRTLIKENVIYAQPTAGLLNVGFDLYKISNDFINLNHNEMNEYVNDENLLRGLFLLFLITVFYALHIFVFAKFKILTYKNNIHYLSLLFFLLLYSIAILLPYLDGGISKDTISIFFVFKNNLFLIFVPIAFIFLSNTVNNAVAKITIFVVSIIFLLIIAFDHFAQVVLGSRYFFSTTAKFAGNISDGYPFLITYLSTFAGLYYVLSLILYINLFFVLPNRLFCKRFFAILFVLFFVSFSFLFTFNKNLYSRFYNVFQVNINGLFTEGDFKRPYVAFKTYNENDMNYHKKNGMNKRQSVIVILVESFGCDCTFLCGKKNNYSSYIEELAHNNIWFPYYYSNNFHTNGAIFTISTGLPLINGAHGEDTYFNKIFYRNDLINEFKNNGYITAYYTPANLVFNKNRQLNMSNYSYISSVSDDYYTGKDKKGVFGSVSDGEMYNKIMVDLKKNDEPKFFMLTTISTHTPYITPWGTRDISLAYSYSDFALREFINNLKKINYFDNGIVVITGDHKGWGNSNNINSKTNYSMEDHRMPLIVINGKDHGKIIDNVSFSHASLGVMLEYLMLPTYSINKYQINPLDIDGGNEVILNYDAAKSNVVLVKHGTKEDVVLLDGDQTRFLGNKFTDDEELSILGFLSYLRP